MRHNTISWSSAKNYGGGQKIAAQFGQIGWPILLKVQKSNMKFQFLILQQAHMCASS